MKLADQGVGVAHSGENAGKRSFEGRYIGLRQMVADDRRGDAGPQRIPTGKKRGPARRTLGHRPNIGKFNAVARNTAEVRERCRAKTAESEELQLINANVIEDDEENVRLLRRF